MHVQLFVCQLVSVCVSGELFVLFRRLPRGATSGTHYTYIHTHTTGQVTERLQSEKTVKKTRLSSFLLTKGRDGTTRRF